jgi:hypothetical protein
MNERKPSVLENCRPTGSRFREGQPLDELEKPRTLMDAAIALGVPYHVVQRAARRGLVPTYRLGTSRPYVKLRDFFDLMERSANC